MIKGSNNSVKSNGIACIYNIILIFYKEKKCSLDILNAYNVYKR